MSPVPEALRRTLSAGPMRFDHFVEWSLYEPTHGFFATGGGAGRGGADFITSPEVGPLFGAVVARWLDRVWDELGRPETFTVVEAAAGRGALALAVRAAAPVCASCLEWVLVERSAALRARQGEHLELDGRSHPRFVAADDLPAEPVTGVVLANELLDNLPFRLMQREAGAWREVWVAAAGGTLSRVLLDAPAEVSARLDQLVPAAPDGAEVPWQEAAAHWVRRALATIERGRLLVVDYTDTTTALAGRPASHWLRTYRSHDRGGDPLDAPGSQDITVEVAVDQLPSDPAPTTSTQTDWLRAHGIDDLVAEARALWAERAATGDLAAMRARSTVSEAEALTDPDGLGAFTVLEWARP